MHPQGLPCAVCLPVAALYPGKETAPPAARGRHDGDECSDSPASPLPRDTLPWSPQACPDRPKKNNLEFAWSWSSPHSPRLLVCGAAGRAGG